MQIKHQLERHVLNKMKVDYIFHSVDENLQKIIPKYFLNSENQAQQHPMDIGARLKMTHAFQYECTSCHKSTKKLYSGFCYVCLIKRPEADLCIVSPHRCHYMQGTCRLPEFGHTFCYQPHFLYLAFTDKYKIGLTRHNQIPIRWIDQGATLASPILKTYSRHQAGILEKFLTQKLADKSHWQSMLKMKNHHPSLDEFVHEREQLKSWVQKHEPWNRNEWRVDAPQNLLLKKETEFLEKSQIYEIAYPLSDKFPEKLKSIKLERSPQIDAHIIGIKGQYLMLDNDSVLNLRNHSGFIVQLEYGG